jgi:hypothetical protein
MMKHSPARTRAELVMCVAAIFASGCTTTVEREYAVYTV